MADDLRQARCNTIASRARAKSRSSRPSRSPISTISRSPIRRASPTPASPSCAIRRRRPNYTARANLVGVITNGTAVLGLGAIGPLAAKPVMEGKAVLFKKFAGIDVFDIELDATRPGQVRRDRRGARADLRRDQSRGHQGAGMLLHRGEAARAHEDPGLPRRPARHGDHRRRRDPQRAEARRQEDRRGEARDLRRGRRGDLVPRSAREARPDEREHHGHRHTGRGLERPQRGDGPVQGTLRTDTTRAPWAR